MDRISRRNTRFAEISEPMKIIHVVAEMEPAAGPTYSITHLSRGLQTLGYDSQVLYVAKQSAKTPGAEAFRAFPPGNKFAFSPSQSAQIIRRGLSKETIVHAHGLWLWPNVFASVLKKIAPASKLVVAPRGMMEDWAWQYSARAKKIAWRFGQKFCLKADLFHATAVSEEKSIRRRGYFGPVVTLPNGIEVQERKWSPATEPREVLYLGRLHAIKGLDLLIDAWGRLALGRGWRLRIVGPDDGDTLQRLRTRAASLGLANIVFEGPLHGEEKIRAYQSAAIYVLSSHSENFALTVAEALSNGTPVVCTRGAPWEGLDAHDCGRWVPISADGIAEGLRQLTSLSTESLMEMGERGQEWMMRDFSWASIAGRMSACYTWLLEGGNAPENVEFMSSGWRRQSS